MEQVVVRLGAGDQESIHWLVWSSDENEIIASGELPDAQQLSSLKERAGNRPIIALVPTSEVLLKWVSLPPRAGRKALAAVPYMLEDELSNDISQQFFALGDKQGDQLPVAVVSRARMEYWQGLIRNAGLQCSKLLPDTLALPLNDAGWSVMPLGEQLLVRQDQWQGLQGSRNWIEAAITHHAKQLTTPLQLRDYGDSLLQNVPNTEVTSEPLDMPMLVLANEAVRCKFNLLQGAFKPKRQSAGKWQKWRLAAILAGVALLTTLLDKGLELNRLSNQKLALQQQIEQEFKRAFPDVSRIVNVRSQMRQRLASLEQSGSGVSMLTMMTQLADAFSASNVKPQTLRFDSTRAELRIMAEANNFESLEQFRRLAEAKGFEVQQGAINNRDDKVIGSLAIRS